MHTYEDSETHVSLTRTFPELKGWALPALLGEYSTMAALRERRTTELGGVDAPELQAIEQDMSAIADEIMQRMTARDVVVALATLRAEVDSLKAIEDELAARIDKLEATR